MSHISVFEAFTLAIEQTVRYKHPFPEALKGTFEFREMINKMETDPAYAEEAIKQFSDRRHDDDEDKKQ